MKARLNTLMGQTQQELSAFGDSTFSGEQHRGSLILKLMTQFVRDFVASIDGTSLEISTKELCGGARIYYIFNDVFGHALESINPTHNLTVQDIRTAIRNSTGPRPSLFVPEVAFDLLVKPQIKLLEPPSLRCVELVYEELMKICHNCTSAVRRYSCSLELSNSTDLWYSRTGIATLSSTARPADRGRLGAAAGTTRTDLGIRPIAHRNSSRVHQHESSRFRLWIRCRCARSIEGISGEEESFARRTEEGSFSSSFRGAVWRLMR